MRDISTVVKKQQVVESENLCTLFVVVSKFALRDWETSYESMCNYIVGSGCGKNATHHAHAQHG